MGQAKLTSEYTSMVGPEYTLLTKLIDCVALSYAIHIVYTTSVVIYWFHSERCRKIYDKSGRI